MHYKITKKYGKGREMPTGEHYRNIQDAKNFINTEIQQEAIMKVDVTYYLYEGMDVVEEFSSLKTNISAPAPTGAHSSSSTNPFSTRLQPRGANMISDNDEDKKQK